MIFFSFYNPYATSQQHPNSYSVKLEEHPVTSEKFNFKGIYAGKKESFTGKVPVLRTRK